MATRIYLESEVEKIDLNGISTLEEAVKWADEREAAGDFPEGFNLVAKVDGMKYLYTDMWIPLC